LKIFESFGPPMTEFEGRQDNRIFFTAESTESFLDRIDRD
jgi:hypothetical protein